MSRQHRLGWIAPLLLVASALACSSGGDTVTLTTFATLTPDQWTTSFGSSIHDCGSGGLGLIADVPSHGWQIRGDFEHVAAGFADENLASGCHNAQVFRGVVHFDLTTLHPDDVAQAFLHFRRSASAAGFEAATFGPSSISCAGSIQAASDAWLSAPGTTTDYDYIGSKRVPASTYLTMPANDLAAHHDDLANPDATPDHVAIGHDTKTQVTQFTADVTGQVKEWLASGGNGGFALVAATENLDAGDNNSCVSLYDHFTLELFSVGAKPIFSPEPTNTLSAPPKPPILRPSPTPTPRPTSTPTPLPKAHLVIAPTAANASCLNGEFPAITLRNSGNAPLTWSVSADHQVTINPTHGTINPGQSAQVDVTGSVGVPPGTTMTLSFTSNGGNGTTVYTCQ